MNLAPVESSVTRVALSPRLISELGDPHSTLRAVTQRSGPVVIIRAGGEVDAANEHTWRGLVEQAAAVATPPGPFIVDINGLDFIGCCAFAILAAESERCRRRGAGLPRAGPGTSGPVRTRGCWRRPSGGCSHCRPRCGTFYITYC